MHADTLLLRWKEAIPWELTVRELTARRYLTKYKVCTQTSHLCFICLQFPVKPLRKGLIKKVVKKKVRERGSTTDMVLYNIQVQYKHHFCNTAQHLSFHRGTLHTSWNLAAAVPVLTAAAPAAQETLGCRAAHYIHFLLLLLTPHSSHLTVLPFAPFTASQCLLYCPQS